MPVVRFYLLALKGASYLELRLGRHADALQRLEKLVEVDEKDRLGGQALIDVTKECLPEFADSQSA